MENSSKVVSSGSESLILVDADDNPIGELSKAEAHDGQGTLHRAFSIFLFNSRGELLLQRRSGEKRLWPGFWSNTCCSHPRVGESLDVATRRRLDDELNLSADLERVYAFQYQATYGSLGSEHEYCHVYLGRTPDKVMANQEEISEIRFIPASEVSNELVARPGIFTPWFKLEWERLLDEYSERVARYAKLL